MKIFLTGATGFVGSAIVTALRGAGHSILGLARSDANADALAARGVSVHRGDLTDEASLRRGAEDADGVIHCGYIHDFANIAASGVIDTRAVQVFGEVLAGSNRPLVVTSGIAVGTAGVVVTEDTAPDPGSPGKHRIPSEEATLALAPRGVRASVMRLSPSVHGEGDHGFVPMLIAIAREKGVSAYIGEGDNRWPAVHKHDAAELYRLVVEEGAAGSRVHAVADEGVPTRAIAEVIGRKLGLPVVSMRKDEAIGHFGFLAHFFGTDCPATSAKTRTTLGWAPRHATLLEDLEMGTYFG